MCQQSTLPQEQTFWWSGNVSCNEGTIQRCSYASVAIRCAPDKQRCAPAACLITLVSLVRPVL
jgi:hypothetical protein